MLGLGYSGGAKSLSDWRLVGLSDWLGGVCDARLRRMPVLFKQYLSGEKIYTCSSCGTHAADHEELVSKVGLRCCLIVLFCIRCIRMEYKSVCDDIAVGGGWLYYSHVLNTI